MAAQTFPIPADELQDILSIQSVTFDLGDARSFSQTRGGEGWSAASGPRLWSGTVTCGVVHRLLSRQRAALLDLLKEPGATFYIYDPDPPGPYQDQLGVTLGASTVLIASLNADNKRMTLKGLPAGYVLTRGDRLAFDYGSSLRAVHEVTDATVTADGLGVTPEFEVRAHIRPGAAVDAAVTLLRPACKAEIVPGSVGIDVRGGTAASGLSFNWIQVLS